MSPNLRLGACAVYIKGVSGNNGPRSIMYAGLDYDCSG